MTCSSGPVKTSGPRESGLTAEQQSSPMKYCGFDLAIAACFSIRRLRFANVPHNVRAPPERVPSETVAAPKASRKLHCPGRGAGMATPELWAVGTRVRAVLDH
jgi:hypothetical protein